MKLHLPQDDVPVSKLPELESELIEFFVHAAQLLNLPKSIGEIYGFLYFAPEPQSFDDIVNRVEISKGSASQGLRFLKNLYAVKTVEVKNSRREHFIAEVRLSQLASGFLRERIKPQLDEGRGRLTRVVDQLPETLKEENPHFYARIQRLDGWNRRASDLLPVVLALIRS